MTSGSVESQLQGYGQYLYEQCAANSLTERDAASRPSRLPRVAFAVVLVLFVVTLAAGVSRPWSDGASGPSAAPVSEVVPENGTTDSIRSWIEEAERFYGVSVGDPCPEDKAPESGLVMTLSVLAPVGFGSCRVVAFAPLHPGPDGEGNLQMGDYDQNGNLLDASSANMPRVDWSSPVYGQRDDGSTGVIGTQICITDSNGGRYCSGEVSPNP